MGKKGNYEKYISEDEEIRDWFKVSSNRKKVWNVELWLLEELKRICEKHNIKYYAGYGTLLWAVRHKWFIPWDDDMDIIMFRDDYEKLWEVADKELPNNIKLCVYHQWYSKLINTNTAALWDENWWDKDFVGWIWIDIFPMDYASKISFINYSKSIILIFLRIILLSKKCDLFVTRMKKWKQFFVHICKFVFKHIDWLKIYKMHEKISKKVIFRWDQIYTWWCPYLFYPKNIFDKYHDVKFESTTICIPDWYDVYLKKQYWDYMKPVMRQWWHNSWYSVNRSYKEIIETFDRAKTNEDNYDNCEYLFVL